MFVDLLTEPSMVECSELATRLLSVAHEDYRRIRDEAESAVIEWRHSSEDYYPLLDPLGPELWGRSRGGLSSEPVPDGYSHGLARDRFVRVKRRRTSERGVSAQYLLPRSDGDYTTIWMFDERDDLDFHKCQRVKVSRVREDGVRLVVSRGRSGDERRLAYLVAGQSAHVQAISLRRRGPPDREERYVAELDGIGRPIRITDPRTGYVHYERKRPGNVGGMLARLGKELAKQIPKLVEQWAAGREIEGICLMHGDGLERFPPAVLPILTEGPERAGLAQEHSWQVWDPSPWLDVVDPVYFDDGVSAVVDKVSPDLVPWMLEEATERAALECLDELVEKLGRARWPRALRRREPFVVYRANYEEGDWPATFRGVLSPATAEALREREALPPPHEMSSGGEQR